MVQHNMNDITLNAEIKAEFTVNNDGSTTTTIRGAARLAGVDHSVLSRHFSGGDFSSSKLSQKLIKQGFEPGDFFQGIPEVALVTIIEYYSFDAGRRNTKQAKLVYRALAAVGIRAWLHEQLNYQPKPCPNTSTVPTIEEIDLVFAGLEKLNIAPQLIQSAKLSAIAKTFPHLETAAEESKQLLSAQMQVEEIPLSPTKLGKIIAEQLEFDKPISARRINQILIEIGFQDSERVTNSKGKSKIQYKPTKLGSSHSRIQLETAKGHSKTIYVIRWFKSVIPIITEVLENDQ